MKNTQCNNYEDAICKLQNFIDYNWHNNMNGKPLEKRQWLKSSPKNSYNEERYKIEMWVLEGSPIKQIVIINHCMKQIVCFDSWMKKTKEFTWEKI